MSNSPESPNSSPRRWQDTTNIALGLLVLLSPWLLGYADRPTPSWNAWIMGSVFSAGAALMLMLVPHRLWIEWIVGFCGFWTFLSPRILGFTDSIPATATQMALGAVIGILAIWSAISISNARLAAAPSQPPSSPPAHETA